MKFEDLAGSSRAIRFVGELPSVGVLSAAELRPTWLSEFLKVVRAHEADLYSLRHRVLPSDAVLESVREDLVSMGWLVEAGKPTDQKIHRPVLFGDNGSTKIRQEINGGHSALKVILEVESGWGIQGNAVCRDLIRASLVAQAKFRGLGVPQRCEYGSKNTKQNDFLRTRALLDSIYASGRLQLPFRGIPVFGW